MDVNAIANGEGGIFAAAYPNEVFMQQVAAQIVWYNNSALPENLRSRLPSIEELEMEDQICVF